MKEYFKVVVPGLLAAFFSMQSLPAFAADSDATANERVPAQGLDKGKAVFLANCAACHQPDGKGLPGEFPPLAKSD